VPAQVIDKSLHSKRQILWLQQRRLDDTTEIEFKSRDKVRYPANHAAGGNNKSQRHNVIVSCVAATTFSL
tara:strand:+ start:256 stop:465 length:210 start_codon:yes stop_codon:yes gene_type:complete